MYERAKRFFQKGLHRFIGSIVQSAFFQNRGFNQPIFNETDTATLIKEGYQGNADVFAIINYISTLAANIPWIISEVKDQKALASFKCIEEYDVKAMQLELKSQHQLDEHPLLDIMNNPNGLQSGSEFRIAWCGFKLATGNAFINGVRPAAGKNKKLIQELHMLPSQHVDILPGDFRDPVRGYSIDVNGGRTIKFDADEISHSKYFNPDFQHGQSLFGMSPLESAFRNLSTSNEADVARMRAFENQGAVGIISTGGKGDEDQRMSPDELTDLSDTYKDKFGGPENFNKVLFTNNPIKWDKMGLSPVDLAIIKSKIFDLRTFCNIYSLNSGRFNDPENKRFSNPKDGRKADMTDAIMPLLNSLRDELAIWLVPAYEEQEGRKLFLTPDWKSVAVLQGDLEKMVKWLDRAWWITPNQKLKILGMETSDDKKMDRIYKPINTERL